MNIWLWLLSSWLWLLYSLGCLDQFDRDTYDILQNKADGIWKKLVRHHITSSLSALLSTQSKIKAQGNNKLNNNNIERNNIENEKVTIKSRCEDCRQNMGK